MCIQFIYMHESFGCWSAPNVQKCASTFYHITKTISLGVGRIVDTIVILDIQRRTIKW